VTHRQCCEFRIPDDQQDIICYLDQFGMLTTGIALYRLAHILPDHFQQAIDGLVLSGVVRKSACSERRPVYYLAQNEGLTLKELFP
jgi:hypothetical protein